MAKPAFTPVNSDGAPMGEPVAFTALIYTAGTITHRLALHKEISALPDGYRQWVVSHPGIGAKVCTVRAYHKGCPVSSARMSQTSARAAAIATLDEMLERIGSDKFNAVIAKQVQA
jgi:hypothetical protein